MIGPSLLKSDLFCKQTSLNLVIFGKKTRVILGGKKDVSMNVKSQFCKWRSGSIKTHFLDSSLLLY